MKNPTWPFFPGRNFDKDRLSPAVGTGGPSSPCSDPADPAYLTTFPTSWNLGNVFQNGGLPKIWNTIGSSMIWRTVMVNLCKPNSWSTNLRQSLNGLNSNKEEQKTENIRKSVFDVQFYRIFDQFWCFTTLAPNKNANPPAKSRRFLSRMASTYGASRLWHSQRLQHRWKSCKEHQKCLENYPKLRTSWLNPWVDWRTRVGETNKTA